MTREEAIKKIKEAMPTLWKETKEAIQVLIPEFAENEDEKIRKEMIRYFTEMKKGGSAALPYDDCIAYLERQKETGIRWFKSDNVKNPDKPYIDKAGMFYTTDGRMCHASEIEKQKERKDYRKLYEDIAQSEWFKKTYTNKSLGEEFEQEEQRQEWSEKDEKEVAILEGYICSKDWSDRHIDRALGIVDELVNKVKSLRHQPKQEWSEEDRRIIDRACVTLRAYANGELPDILPSEILECVDKLKSIRPSWKPSEEQMEAMKNIAYGMYQNGDGPILRELYEQLKKLI